MRFKESKFVIIISIISFIVIGLTFFAYILNNSFGIGNNYILNTDKLGSFGDFIGAFLGTVLTGIATYLVYKTYISQKKELKKQKKELKLQRSLVAQQQFETTFFNMLNVHRELKNNLFFDRKFSFSNLIINIYESLQPNYIKKEINFNTKGLDVINIIVSDYKNLFNINELKTRVIFFDNSMTFLSTQATYLVEYQNKLKEYLNNYKSSELLNSIDLSKEENLHNIKLSYEIIFSIYKNQISHYCRNVYHILKFIRENEIEKGDSFRKYADIFQSQLNVDEQFLLFYNFIHFNDESKNEYSTINLVEHYQFLENLGLENLITKNHKIFYPNLNLK